MVGRFLGLVGQWESRRYRVADGDRQRITRELFPEGGLRRSFLYRFASLMTLSVLIAVFGLMADSTAVVIGAMLVAPLLGPVLGAAAAIVMGWPNRMLFMVAVTAAGSAGAVVLAAAVAWLLPGSPETLSDEVLVRTAPSLLDLGIALLAGSAAAYARVRREAADALAGVAVAVALVPPLASVGILFQFGLYDEAAGASLLFLANVAGMVLSAGVTFIAVGFVPGRQLLAVNGRIATGLRWSMAAVVLLTIPLAFGRGRVSEQSEALRASTITNVVDVVEPRVTVVEVDVSGGNEVTLVDLVVTGPGDDFDADRVAAILADEFGRAVELRVQAVVTDLSSGSSEG